MFCKVMAPKQKGTDTQEDTTQIDVDFQETVNKRFENIESLLQNLKSHCPAIKDKVAKSEEPLSLETLASRVQFLEDAVNSDDIYKPIRSEIVREPYSAVVSTGSSSPVSIIDIVSTCLFIVFAVVWYRHAFRQ